MEAYRDFMQRQSREYWTRLLKLTDNNVAEATRQARINRTNAYKVLARAGIAPPNHGTRRRTLGAWHREPHD